MVSPLGRLLRGLGALWILHRLLALTLVLVAASGGSRLPEQVAWIGVPGGGGGLRLERAAALLRDHPGAQLVVAGTAAECRFARALLGARGVTRARLLEVDGTTRACAAALQDATEGVGVLVTDLDHAPRLLLSWLLRRPGGAPSIVPTQGAQDRCLELVKLGWYLLRC